MSRTRPCGPEITRGRLQKAGQFLDAASLVHDSTDDHGDHPDAYVTLCVHAGIAALTTDDDRKRAARAAEALLETARRMLAG
ncbi:MAG: hypothetical protein ACRDRK_13865 [Pseudonocardia sp.]